MKILSLFTLAFTLLFTCCKSDGTSKPEPEDVNADITELERTLAEQPTPEPATLEKLLASYEKAVAAHPDRTNANSTYLMKAAETATSLRKFDKALALYEQLIRTCSKSPHVARAFFMKGFVYDNHLQKDDSARIVYQMFLNAYPKDEFADDAQVLLENLGKSDEEMLESIQKKQQDKKTGDPNPTKIVQ